MKNADKSEFSLQRRVALYLMMCQDNTLDRTALHVAAVLLLKHTNSKTAKTVPGRDTIARGMGRSVRAASDGLRSLKVRWLRQVRRVGTSASYEWNWEGVSAEEWQGCSMNVQPSQQHECAGLSADSNVCTSQHIHIEEPISFNQEVKPGSLTFREEKTPVVGLTGNYPNPDVGTLDNVPRGVASTDTDTGKNPARSDIGTTTHSDDGHTNPHSADFEHFWAVYPRREKKEEARQEFVIAVEAGISPTTLIDKAGGYARSVAGREIRYIALPTTWLRDKRWTDDYDPPNSDNPYAEEDAKYPPCPAGMRADVWRGLNRAYGGKPGFTGNRLKQLN